MISWAVFQDEASQSVRRLPSSAGGRIEDLLARFKYSVMAKAFGRPAEVHAYAEQIVIRQDGEVIAEHPRCFGRGQTT